MGKSGTQQEQPIKPVEDYYVQFFALHPSKCEFEGTDEPTFGTGESFKVQYNKYVDNLNKYFVELGKNTNLKSYGSIPSSLWAIVQPRTGANGTGQWNSIPKYLDEQYGLFYNNETGQTEINFDKGLNISESLNNLKSEINSSNEKANQQLRNELGTNIYSKYSSELITPDLDAQNAADSWASGSPNIEKVAGDSVILRDRYLLYKFGVNYGLESVLIAASENT